MKPNACFIVRDRNRQALTYVHYQEEPGRAAMLSALQWLQYATASSAQQNPGTPMVQKSDQTACSDAASVHRAENLDIADWIETEAARDAGWTNSMMRATAVSGSSASTK